MRNLRAAPRPLQYLSLSIYICIYICICICVYRERENIYICGRHAGLERPRPFRYIYRHVLKLVLLQKWKRLHNRALEADEWAVWVSESVCVCACVCVRHLQWTHAALLAPPLAHVLRHLRSSSRLFFLLSVCVCECVCVWESVSDWVCVCVCVCVCVNIYKCVYIYNINTCKWL